MFRPELMTDDPFIIPPRIIRALKAYNDFKPRADFLREVYETARVRNYPALKRVIKAARARFEANPLSVEATEVSLVAQFRRRVSFRDFIIDMRIRSEEALREQDKLMRDVISRVTFQYNLGEKPVRPDVLAAVGRDPVKNARLQSYLNTAMVFEFMQLVHKISSFEFLKDFIFSDVMSDKNDNGIVRARDLARDRVLEMSETRFLEWLHNNAHAANEAVEEYSDAVVGAVHRRDANAVVGVFHCRDANAVMDLLMDLLQDGSNDISAFRARRDPVRR